MSGILWFDEEGYFPLDSDAQRECGRALECLHIAAEESVASDVGDKVRAALAELTGALRHSLTLQSHYALLLNQHDGGERMQFGSPQLWVDRLYEIGAEGFQGPEIVTEEDVRAHDVAQGGNQCSRCGCTDNSPCEEGCGWVSSNLCSSCAARELG